jgi:hypothetical protein
MCLSSNAWLAQRSSRTTLSGVVQTLEQLVLLAAFFLLRDRLQNFESAGKVSRLARRNLDRHNMPNGHRSPSDGSGGIAPTIARYVTATADLGRLKQPKRPMKTRPLATPIRPHRQRARAPERWAGAPSSPLIL